ncbi:hypothetical protein LOTGIDRAFT_155082 [Lottia gigantea]|uniref:Uncharacterized protein n=1 Tax=Lottia gigantea TaxID=225164 RepID=V3ZSP1_LOTGI|nr:hypothetical protein LOTGIDRAFT_155082 [Lottia gigantea]ESO85595.1 hypothetical protein LOTGIDRAFT_155082 [Lottia gigantea]
MAQGGRHSRQATMQNLSEEEMKKRFEFLKEQRDKLVEMKRKERSKTLQTAEKSYPKRPSSARVAKEAMRLSHVPEKKSVNPDDEKKLAMRRAIASRIKSKVIGEK